MLGLALAWSLAGPGAACPVDPAIGTVASTRVGLDARARHDFLAAGLARGARQARAWSLGWGLGYVLVSATQLAITPAVPAGTRTDLYVGAASAGFGALVRAVSIPRVVREQRRLRRGPRRDPGDCASVRALERALVRSARWERRGRSVLMHLGAIAYNVAVGLVLGVGLDRPVPGIRQAVIGSTVGQIMLITQPMASVATLSAYREGRIAPVATALVVPGGGGAALAWHF
jgi:hypothetical protein